MLSLALRLHLLSHRLSLEVPLPEGVDICSSVSAFSATLGSTVTNSVYHDFPEVISIAEG